jgi:squalene-hopene/tetraprenyl-beta-curcumene cyclase
MRHLLLILLAATIIAGEATLPAKAEVDALAAQAQAWILSQQQANGALVPGKIFTLGITAMSTLALASPPNALPADHPAMIKALAYIDGFKQKDGGIYAIDEGLGNYTTALALQVYVLLRPQDKATIEAAQRYLLGLQNTDQDSLGFGGIGYGDKGRGHEDLSNTSYALQALRDSGVPADSPQMQAALKFLEKCQDLSSVNKQPWVGAAGGKNGPGGAVYGPADAKGSWEKQDPSQSEKFTTTGTMTYSLLSSYLTLQLSPEDPRVAAALAWAKSAYQFEINPGMAEGKTLQGLFHYYTLMGRTFAMLKTDTLDLGNGKIVDWRADLFAAIKPKAQIVDLDGGVKGAFWINSAPRWAEGMPHLTTSYMLRALKAISSRLP